MAVLIDNKSNAKKIADILSKKLQNRKKKGGNLAKHFGKLKRNIDGLEYQIAMRENED